MTTIDKESFSNISGKVMDKFDRNFPDSKMGKGLKGLFIVVAFLIAFVLFVVINPIVMINAGQVGVVLNWGAVSNQTLEEGIHWIMPIRDKVIKMDVTTRKEEKGTTASSKDLQEVSTKVAAIFHVDKKYANKVYQQFYQDYVPRIIQPAMEEFLKKTTAMFTAEEMITKREQVKSSYKKVLAENLALYHIILDDIFMTDFKFSKSFDEAIEAKVTAEQNALREKNNLDKVKFEAQQKIVSAEAAARAIKIQAEAITQQGGREYVNLKAVEKWDGHLPQQMIPGSTLPFINLTTPGHPQK